MTHFHIVNEMETRIGLFLGSDNSAGLKKIANNARFIKTIAKIIRNEEGEQFGNSDQNNMTILDVYKAGVVDIANANTMNDQAIITKKWICALSDRIEKDLAVS